MVIRLCFGFAPIRWATACGVALAALAGCASIPKSARVDPAIADAILQRIAARVARCYQAPRVGSAARQIVTRLTIRLNPDGTLAMPPLIVAQTGITVDNASEAGRVAEAAGLAVIRCSPFRLPAERYRSVWRSFDLIFSRNVRV
jgi:hypothetical protein